MEIDVRQNLERVVSTLQNRDMKLTNIAKAMGYTTTTQLHHTLEGKSMLSTKAVIELIQNLNVNPLFLYTGKGEMFFSDESELDSLQKKYAELERKHGSLADDAIRLAMELKQAVDRYNKLIDITSAAMENTQKQNPKEEESITNQDSVKK